MTTRVGPEDRMTNERGYHPPVPPLTAVCPYKFTPTFPLPPAEIESRANSNFWGGPLAIVTLLVGSALILFTYHSMELFLSYLGVWLFTMVLGWKKSRRSFLRRAERELIEESNQRQSRALLDTVRHLSLHGQVPYALILEEFTNLKTKVETLIHSSKLPRSLAEELDNQVDGVCATLCDRVYQLLHEERGLVKIILTEDAENMERLNLARNELCQDMMRSISSLRRLQKSLSWDGSTTATPIETAPLVDWVNELEDGSRHLESGVRRVSEMLATNEDSILAS